MNERDEILRPAILIASTALDPYHQDQGWPDPIAWDGRPLQEQAEDLRVRLDAAVRDAPRRSVDEARLRIALAVLEAAVAPAPPSADA